MANEYILSLRRLKALDGLWVAPQALRWTTFWWSAMSFPYLAFQKCLWMCKWINEVHSKDTHHMCLFRVRLGRFFYDFFWDHTMGWNKFLRFGTSALPEASSLGPFILRCNWSMWEGHECGLLFLASRTIYFWNNPILFISLDRAEFCNFYYYKQISDWFGF